MRSSNLDETLAAIEAAPPSALREILAAIGPAVMPPHVVLQDPDRLAAFASHLVEQAPVYLTYLVEKVGQIAPDGPASVDAKRSLANLGLNSLDGAALVMLVEMDLGIEIPLVDLFDEQTVEDMALRLARDAAVAAVAATAA